MFAVSPSIAEFFLLSLALSTTIAILSSTTTLEYLKGQDVAITFLKDLKQLLMSEENMTALLSIDGWQLKLLNFLKISAAALEKRKDDEEARIKKIESKPLPEGWEIKYEKLSGRRSHPSFPFIFLIYSLA